MEYELCNPVPLVDSLEPRSLIETGDTTMEKWYSEEVPLSQQRAKRWLSYLISYILLGALIGILPYYGFIIAWRDGFDTTVLFLFLLPIGNYLNWALIGGSELPNKHLRQIYFYDKNLVSQIYYHEKDAPTWLENRFYWVIRHTYRFPFEITLKKSIINFIIPFLVLFHLKKDDWERIEIWVNAENGAVEWVVADYHWRELWYQANKKLNLICADIKQNFHTPIPVLIDFTQDHLEATQEEIKRWRNFENEQKKAHLNQGYNTFFNTIENNRGILKKAVVSTLLQYPWSHIRYPRGLEDDGRLYRNHSLPAIEVPTN